MLVRCLVRDERDDHQREQEADENDASDEGEDLGDLDFAKLVGYFWSNATIGGESAERTIHQKHNSTNAR